MIPNKIYNLIAELIPMVILFSLVMIIVRTITAIYTKEKIIAYKELKNLLYIIYCFVLFALVTTTDFTSYSNNFIPFKEIMRYKFSSIYFYRNVIGNIILFIPFGYLISDMVKERANKINIFITALITLLTSLSIESIQMYIGRSFDVDDILLNFIGGIIGYLIFKLIHILSSKIPEKFKNNLFKLISILVMIAVLSLLFYFSYEVVL